jgi:hypothetical protein
MAAVWKMSGGAPKMAAAKMAASRKMSARKMSGGAHRLAAIKLNSTTQVRPLAASKLAAVAHQMAARRMSARKMSAGGARKMSATADAAAAPGVAVAAATPASAYASPEEAVFKGDFDAALAMAQAQGAMSALASGLQPFIEAGNLIKRNRFDAARFYFRKAESDPRFGRLAQYWRCKMYRLENRGQSAIECFAAAGLTEGVQP